MGAIRGKAGDTTNEVSERGAGGAMFAAVIMIMAGLVGIFQGIGLIAKGTYFVQPANYWINTGASTWGWWLLIVGLVVLAAGFGMFSAAVWARWLGIDTVSVQAITNFLFHPGAALVGDHVDPYRPVGHPLAVCVPTRGRRTDPLPAGGGNERTV
jgi:hypothetical protein